MFNRTVPHLRALALAVVAIAALPFQHAHADIIAATYQSSDSFHYHVIHMPDFDQRRAGLGANGRCHCVPTSTMNLFGYIGNHGFPQVTPGSGHWQLQENFDQITTSICVLASPEFFGTPMMNTRYASDDPPLCGSVVPNRCATGGTGWFNGMTVWLSAHPEMVWTQHATLEHFSANFDQLAQMLMQGNGRIGLISWGRYDVVGEVFGIPVVQIDGGHSVTVVKAERDPNMHGPDGGVLWVRDPNDPPTNFTQQSLFKSRVMSVTDVVVIRVDEDNNFLHAGLASILDYNPASTRHSIMHRIRTVGPAVGYSFQNTSPIVTQLQPSQFFGHSHNPIFKHEIPGIPGILAADLHPHTGELIFVNEGSEVVPVWLRRYNPLTGESAMIDPPNGYWIGLGGVAVGRDGAVYASCVGHTGGHFLCSWPQLQQDPAPPFEVLELVPHTIVYVDAVGETGDRIVAAAAAEHALMIFDPKAPAGVPPMQIVDLPSSVPPLSAAVGLAALPADGRVVALYPWGGGILIDISDPANPEIETATIPGLSDVQDFTFDSQGNLIVAAGGVSHVYVFGDWSTSLVEHPFHGLKVEGRFFIERSRTNHDPDVHDRLGWDDVPGDLLEPLGDEVPDCTADLAPPHGTVGVPDLLALLAAWGPCPDPTFCPEDIAPSPGGDGHVGVPDLLELLSQWGPCP